MRLNGCRIELDVLMTNPALISFVVVDGLEMVDVQRGNADYDALDPISPWGVTIVRGDQPIPLNYTRGDHSSKVRHVDPRKYNL